MEETKTINEKAERSWILYDVANSAFVLVIVTAILPIFFKDFVAKELPAATSTAYWGYINSAASFMVACLSPIIGLFADQFMRKKQFFIGFLLLGLLSTLALTLLQQGQILFCLVVFFLARIGWSGANLLYDSFLLDITSKDRMDMVSTRGYGYGYIGSVVPFTLIVALILFGGMDNGLPELETKIGFGIVVLWWLVFSLPMLKNVQQRHHHENSTANLAKPDQIFSTIRQIRHNHKLFYFLLAYFFYIDGVGTVISMSTAYGRDLGFGVALLIGVLLFIQIIAFPFALIAGRLADRFSTKFMLNIGIIFYILITLFAFLLPWLDSVIIKTALFWVIAFMVAASMGGIQALSRSFFGKLIPQEQSAEYFGFYNIFGKFAAITGPLLMGLVTSLCGDSRWGILSLLPLFLMGAFFLAKVEE